MSGLTKDADAMLHGLSAVGRLTGVNTPEAWCTLSGGSLMSYLTDRPTECLSSLLEVQKLTGINTREHWASVVKDGLMCALSRDTKGTMHILEALQVLTGVCTPQHWVTLLCGSLLSALRRDAPKTFGVMVNLGVLTGWCTTQEWISGVGNSLMHALFESSTSNLASLTTFGRLLGVQDGKTWHKLTSRDSLTSALGDRPKLTLARTRSLVECLGPATALKMFTAGQDSFAHRLFSPKSNATLAAIRDIVGVMVESNINPDRLPTLLSSNATLMDALPHLAHQFQIRAGPDDLAEFMEAMRGGEYSWRTTLGRYLLDVLDPWAYVSTSDLHVLKASYREEQAAKAAKKAAKAKAKAMAAAKANIAAPEKEEPGTGSSRASPGAPGAAPLFKKKTKSTKKKRVRKDKKRKQKRVFIKDAAH